MGMCNLNKSETFDLHKEEIAVFFIILVLINLVLSLYLPKILT